MILKDVSINSESLEISQVVVNNQSSYPNAAKGDIFLISDFGENIGKQIELQRNAGGKYFKGVLESVKIDIEPFTNMNVKDVLYKIKLKEHEDVFEIYADSIEHNPTNLQKYYFKQNNDIIWRIIFF